MKKLLTEVKNIFPNAIEESSWNEQSDGEINLNSSTDPSKNLSIQVGADYAGILQGNPEDFNEIFEGSHEKVVSYLKKNYKKLTKAS